MADVATPLAVPVSPQVGFVEGAPAPLSPPQGSEEEDRGWGQTPEFEVASDCVLYSERGIKAVVNWRNSFLEAESGVCKRFCASLIASGSAAFLAATSVIEGVVYGIISCITTCFALMQCERVERWNAHLVEGPRVGFLYGALGTFYAVQLLRIDTWVELNEELVGEFCPIAGNLLRSSKGEFSAHAAEDEAFSEAGSKGAGRPEVDLEGPPLLSIACSNSGKPSAHPSKGSSRGAWQPEGSSGSREKSTSQYC